MNTLLSSRTTPILSYYNNYTSKDKQLTPDGTLIESFFLVLFYLEYLEIMIQK